MSLLQEPNYNLTSMDLWTGRIDGTARSLMRWHQAIDLIDLRNCGDLKQSIVFLGFCCDEGVRRNQGRVGAKQAPYEFRKVLANLPVHFSESTRLLDAGDIHCVGNDLESAQMALGQAVSKVIANGGIPIVLGGGHEVTFGHYLGIQDAMKGKKIGIINLDAHLDIRETIDGKGNSGTGFFQIEGVCEKQSQVFYYLPIGIDKMSNTQALLSFAESKGVESIYKDDFSKEQLPGILERIDTFANLVDHVYLTIDMDVFAAPFAPGVSALAYNGIVPDAVFKSVFKKIVSLPNLSSVDIAEFNPVYDIDHRTARLAASLIFELIADL